MLLFNNQVIIFYTLQYILVVLLIQNNKKTQVNNDGIKMVESMGLEPTTLCMRYRCATNCAITPHLTKNVIIKN